MIVVVFLYDMIEDIDVIWVEIDFLFGEEIGKLVEGLIKIKCLDLVLVKVK